jgi:hypothetical protein
MSHPISERAQAALESSETLEKFLSECPSILQQNHQWVRDALEVMRGAGIMLDSAVNTIEKAVKVTQLLTKLQALNARELPNENDV